MFLTIFDLIKRQWLFYHCTDPRLPSFYNPNALNLRGKPSPTSGEGLERWMTRDATNSSAHARRCGVSPASRQYCRALVEGGRTQFSYCTSLDITKQVSHFNYLEFKSKFLLHHNGLVCSLNKNFSQCNILILFFFLWNLWSLYYLDRKIRFVKV